MAFSEALRKEAIKQANTVIFQIKQSIEVSKHDVNGHGLLGYYLLPGVRSGILPLPQTEAEQCTGMGKALP